MSKKLFYFDVETTGLDARWNTIHQLSFIIEIDGEVKESVNYHIRPIDGKKIDEEALEVSNLTIDQVLQYPEAKGIYKELVQTLSKYVGKYDKNDKFFLVGYNNASFDNQFLREWFVDNGDKYFGSWFWPNPIDVYVLASVDKMSKRPEMPNAKLGTMAEYYGYKVDDEQLHNAMYDVELTRNIYNDIRTKVRSVFVVSQEVNVMLDNYHIILNGEPISEIAELALLQNTEEIRNKIIKLLTALK